MKEILDEKRYVNKKRGSLLSHTIKRLNDPGVLLIVIVTSFIYFCALASILYPGAAHSAIPEDHRTKINPWHAQKGELYFKGVGPDKYIPAPNLNTTAQINVHGLVAKALVTQNFKNETSKWLEGIYVFPLPDNAAVTSLRMYIGKRIIEGQIKERKTAKKIYTKAKKEGKKASLLEQERPNIFTISLANIGPEETIRVELSYEHTVSYDNGVFSLRFPTVVAPRYIPGTPLAPEITVVQKPNPRGWAKATNAVPDAERITPFVSPPSPANSHTGHKITIKVNLDCGFETTNIKSPYHTISTQKKANGTSQIILGDIWDNPDRDFLLQWQAQKGEAPQAALFSEQIGGDTYLLMMLVPPYKEKKAAHHNRREIIFVLDVSGSMAGESLNQAKAALKSAITSLTNEDYFNIIVFNDEALQLFGKAQRARANAVRTALYYVKGLNADGGTQIKKALLTALDGKKHPGRIRQVVFLTDGSVGNEVEMFKLIHQRLGDNRLFTVGIGPAPNSYFMRNAALQGRGTYTFISKSNQIQAKMAALFDKIESPVLTDIKIDKQELGEIESFPNPIPDLYSGEPIVVVTKTATLPRKIDISANLGGRRWSAALSPTMAAGQAGISTLWARAKVKSLMDSTILGTDKQTVRNEVIETAIKHHLVSKFTSLVAVDVTPSRPSDKETLSKNVKNNLPKGWKYEKIFGVPQTATISEFCLFLGALSLILASLLLYLVKTMRSARDIL